MNLLNTHVTGESVFIDDIPMMSTEVFVSYLGSPVASGLLHKIDFKNALKIEGVVAIYTAKDIVHNLWGTIKKDQPILVDNLIGYHDEPLCIVVAETKTALAKAKKLIEFDIEITTPILNIEEAIEKQNFLHKPLPFKCGDIDKAFENSEFKLSGQFEIGGQEHFYLESQAAIAYPDDGCSIKVISSSQHPTETQHLIAEALGLPFHKVICEVKRMGGAFGGKESQAAPFAAMAAIAAFKLNRPARIILNKDEDMKVTGKRHPFLNYYDVAFNSEGKIVGLKIKYYADGGAYTDLSPSIIDRTLFHSDGSYYIENALLEAWVCKTNTHSNTAFRGFGGPQGNMTIENIIEDIAIFLKKDSAQVRKINLYQKDFNNFTPYGQCVENNLLPDIYEKIISTSNYEIRRKEINQFNQTNKFFLKGLALTGCKFGIAFTARFLNQGNALVHIHRDGTVQVSTGATEMGQGVNSKIQKVVAEAFGIQLDDVKVTVTSTEKNANTSPTAASSGSDLNCSAALVACEKILNRLKQVALIHFSDTPINITDEIEIEGMISKSLEEQLKKIKFSSSKVCCEQREISWFNLIQQAYLNRVSISDYGHFKTSGLSFDRQKAKGNAFKYFTSGMAISEVQVDRFTGQYKIVRSDLLMDIGNPIDESIDLGQISGGFIQGVGWVTTEKLFYSQDGALLSHSPTTYKIPNIQDIPREFNIDILKNDFNQNNNVQGSKAVGEPPLLLSASVFMALKNAISYLSSNSSVNLSSPATPEVVLLEMNRHGI